MPRLTALYAVVPLAAGLPARNALWRPLPGRMSHRGSVPRLRLGEQDKPHGLLHLAVAGAIVTILAVQASIPAAAGEPWQGGTIRYGHLQEPPRLYAGRIQAGFIQPQYAANLVARTHDGRIVPWLVTG